MKAFMDPIGGSDLRTVEDDGCAWKKGDIEIWMYPDTEHVVTQEMVWQTAAWIWRWALNAVEPVSGNGM